MKISREKAMQIWYRNYGCALYAEDFDGNLMYREAYGDEGYFIYEKRKRIYCGWNIHHILPLARGGSDTMENMTCTNILTNREAADKITFWIDGSLYQVQKTTVAGKYEIVRLFQRRNE